MDEIIIRAFAAGADEACLIPARQIPVNPDLAKLCKDPRCADYGRAPGCPPHSPGPKGFRNLQNKSEQALVIRLKVLETDLMTDRCNVIMERLQSIAALLEQQALIMGYSDAMAFAGGSCKRIFCHQYNDCPVLSENGKCRFPDRARPSMSSFGIDLLALMEVCGWPAQFVNMEDEPSIFRQSWVAAIILLGSRKSKLELSCRESIQCEDIS